MYLRMHRLVIESLCPKPLCILGNTGPRWQLGAAPPRDTCNAFIVWPANGAGTTPAVAKHSVMNIIRNSIVAVSPVYSMIWLLWNGACTVRLLLCKLLSVSLSLELINFYIKWYNWWRSTDRNVLFHWMYSWCDLLQLFLLSTILHSNEPLLYSI